MNKPLLIRLSEGGPDLLAAPRPVGTIGDSATRQSPKILIKIYKNLQLERE